MNGQMALQSYAQVWPAGWIVGLYLPIDQAQLPLADFIRKLWWLWLPLAILMLPLLWWLLGRVLSPLKRGKTNWRGRAGPPRGCQSGDEYAGIAASRWYFQSG